MCKCNNIQAGTYERQTSMLAPFLITTITGEVKHYLEGHDGKNYTWVCIDTCLVQEIAELWQHGIETIECCCGHNKRKGYIMVTDGSIDRMLELGYVNEDRKDKCKNFFYPLSNAGVPITVAFDQSRAIGTFDNMASALIEKGFNNGSLALEPGVTIKPDGTVVLNEISIVNRSPAAKKDRTAMQIVADWMAESEHKKFEINYSKRSIVMIDLTKKEIEEADNK